LFRLLRAAPLGCLLARGVWHNLCFGFGFEHYMPWLVGARPALGVLRPGAFMAQQLVNIIFARRASQDVAADSRIW